jgi:hypothetical protein
MRSGRPLGGNAQQRPVVRQDPGDVVAIALRDDRRHGVEGALLGRGERQGVHRGSPRGTPGHVPRRVHAPDDGVLAEIRDELLGAPYADVGDRLLVVVPVDAGAVEPGRHSSLTECTPRGASSGSWDVAPYRG